VNVVPKSFDNCGEGVDADDFRAVMSQFVTGVTVVTISCADGPHGTTVNAFTSLSLNPPMVLVCLRGDGRSAATLQRSGYFGVSILGHEQLPVGRLFATGGRPSGEAGFADVPHRMGVTGVPLLDGAVAHIECQVSERIIAGDHVVFLGQVLEVATGTAGEPLAFHRGRFLSVA
jgi:flavin reductase (DIM6/NTAB) family NADH-FMN oxidoreductase RutF